MDAQPAQARRHGRGFLALAIALTPAIAAVWLVPWFVTQDGPAHVYNSEIIRASFSADSPYASTYEVRKRPLPNWLAHAALASLGSIASPRTADRVLMTLSLVAPAAGAFLLRRVVVGRDGEVPAALYCSLLGMNVAWLYGFYGYLLGLGLTGITWAAWWGGRARFTAVRTLGLAALLVIGYFAHLVALGLALGGLVVLAALETPSAHRARLRARTLLAVLPVAPLLIVYRRLMRGGGGLEPMWMVLTRPWSLGAWKAQLGWVEPISLTGKLAAPFREEHRTVFLLCSPLVWLAVGGLAFGLASIGSVPRNRRGWLVLTVLLVFAGAGGPDTLGPTHGNYLAMRVLIAALMTTTTMVDFGSSRRIARFGTFALGIAWMLQAAFVWDCALRSDRVVRDFVAVRGSIQRGARLGTLLVETRGPTRANPVLHADCLLGLGGNIVWANYETAFYYFPVAIRPGVPHPPVLEFEELARMDHPRDARARAARWERLLADHAVEIDAVVVRGSDARLDAVTGRLYDEVGRSGSVRVFARRGPAAP